MNTTQSYDTEGKTTATLKQGTLLRSGHTGEAVKCDDCNLTMSGGELTHFLLSPRKKIGEGRVISNEITQWPIMSSFPDSPEKTHGCTADFSKDLPTYK